MKNIYLIAGIVIGASISLASIANAAFPPSNTSQGGTGTTTPSGILYGDNGATLRLKTVSIGSGLSFSAGTLTATGGSTASTTLLADNNTFSGTNSFTSLLTLGNASSSQLSNSSNFYLGSTFAPNSNVWTNPIGRVGSSVSGLDGVEFRNTTGGTGSEFRFIISDNTGGPYIAFSMPASTNTATLFGQTRSAIASLFTNGSPARILAIGTVASSDVLLATNNAERIRITSGGNVGIGTSSPARALHVSNAAESVMSITNSLATADQTWTAGVGSGTQFTQGYFVIGPGTSVTASTYALRLDSLGNVVARTGMSAPVYRSQITGVGDTGILAWTNTGGNFNGYASVGATHANAGTAGSDLRLYMGTNAASKIDFRDWGDTVYATLLKSGNFGIGTTTPNWKFQVAGTNPSIALSDTGASANTKHWLLTSGGGNFTIGTSTDSFGTSTPAALTITNAGNFGIGTTTPSYKLSVGNGSVVTPENKLATSTNMTVDWSQSNQQLVQIGTVATTIGFSNVINGATLRLILCNPNAAAGAVTFTGVEWSAGTVPTQTTTANVCDAWSFIATQATSTTATTKIFGAMNANFP